MNVSSRPKPCSPLTNLEHTLKIKAKRATAPPMTPVYEICLVLSRTSPPHAVMETFLVVNSSLMVQDPVAQAVILAFNGTLEQMHGKSVILQVDRGINEAMHLS
jgi:hypothetical protein